MHSKSSSITTPIGMVRVSAITLLSVAMLVGLSLAALTPPQEKIAFIRLVSGEGYEIFVMSPDGTGQTRLTNLPGSPARPSLSPDGSKIVFDYQLGLDNPEIYVINIDGTGLTNLSNNSAHDNQPSFSPDGNKVVFMSSRDGKLEVYVMNADGSDQNRVTDNSCQEAEPSFSPDGSRILFEANCNFVRDIYAINADGTGLTNLTPNDELDCCSSDFRPAFSPDGSEIVFASDRDGPYELYIMNADGTNPTRLTLTGKDDEPSFSPDGSKIVFMSTRDGGSGEIYVMNTDGSGASRLTFAGGLSPSWGGPVAIPTPTPTPSPTPTPTPTPTPEPTPSPTPTPTPTPPPSPCEIIQITNGGSNLLTPGRSLSSGGMFAIASDQPLAPEHNGGGFHIFFSDWINFQWITSDLYPDWGSNNNSPAISYGRDIAFASDGDPLGLNSDRNQEIFLYKPNTPIKQITSSEDYSNEFPAISGFGNRVAFLRRVDSYVGMSLYDVSTQTSTELVNDNTPGWFIGPPSINANGTRIAFGSNGDYDFITDNEDGNYEIFLYDGVRITQVTRTTSDHAELIQGNFAPSISADGTRIAFMSNVDLTQQNPDGNFEIFTYNVTTRAFTQITNTTTEDPPWIPSNSAPAISGDGKRIAFVSNRDLTGGNPDGQWQIFLYDSITGSFTQITVESNIRNFSPSIDYFGKLVAFNSDEDGVQAYLASCPTPNTMPGVNVTVTAGPVTVNFSEVSQAGETTVTEIDPATAGTLPGGYSLGPGLPAYEITTTAQYTPPITVCIQIPEVSDPDVFAALRILHGENGTLVDRTVLPPDSPAPDFATRTLCARVDSLSPFVVAQLLPPVYSFSGFLQPVENLPTLNITGAGSSIPVKFSLSGNHGLAIFAPGYPVSNSIPCDAGEPGTVIAETVNAGGSSLRYDTVTDQYTYVWRTERSWRGTCRMLVVRLNDNTEHTAKFRFR